MRFLQTHLYLLTEIEEKPIYISIVFFHMFNDCIHISPKCTRDNQTQCNEKGPVFLYLFLQCASHNTSEISLTINHLFFKPWPFDLKFSQRKEAKEQEINKLLCSFVISAIDTYVKQYNYWLSCTLKMTANYNKILLNIFCEIRNIHLKIIISLLIIIVNKTTRGRLPSLLSLQMLSV